MAKQLGPIYIKGTLDDLTFYQMDGEHYVRMKSRLSKKKVLTCPRFALTRMHANQLAEASRIASIIYRQLPKEERNIKLFRSIVGKAKILLWTGKEKEVVRELLLKEFHSSEVIKSLSHSSMVNGEWSMMNSVKGERSEVKDERVIRGKTSDVRKRDYFMPRTKGREGAKVIELRRLLLVNEVGKLMEKLNKSIFVSNYMVLDPPTPLSRGSG